MTTRISVALVLAAMSVIAGPLSALAGQTEPWPGLREYTPRVHALTGARIITAPGDTIDNGTLIVRDGRIVALGAALEAPADARVWNCSRSSPQDLSRCN